MSLLVIVVDWGVVVVFVFLGGLFVFVCFLFVVGFFRGGGVFVVCCCFVLFCLIFGCVRGFFVWVFAVVVVVVLCQ